LTGSDSNEIQLVKKSLDSTFGIKDLGQLHYFLGFEVSHNQDGITLTQRKFTQDLLKDSGFLNAKPTAIPLPINLKLTSDSGVPLPNPTTYRTMWGNLIFFVIQDLIFLLRSNIKSVHAKSNLFA